MKKRAQQNWFEVRHSPIHGFGVFALRRIRKGTTITEYIGDRVSHEEADSRYENKEPDDNHTFLFTVDSKTVIDGGVGGNDARYINHGCDPNCESTTQNKRIYIEAVRTIQPGEELAYDYQIERDPEDAPNVDEVFACRCGAEKCRGSMLVAPQKRRKKKRVTAAPAKATGKAKGKAGAKAKATSKAKASSKSRTQTRSGSKSNARVAARAAAATKAKVGSKAKSKAATRLPRRARRRAG